MTPIQNKWESRPTKHCFYTKFVADITTQNWTILFSFQIHYHTFYTPNCSSYGSWIYNYLCNQCLLPLKLWVWTLFMGRWTRYTIMW